MKKRSGFVSNSSSSSFILDKEWMTEEQIEKIKDWLGDECNYTENDEILNIYVGCDSEIEKLFYEINLGYRAVKGTKFYG